MSAYISHGFFVSFVQNLGHMDVLPVLGKHLNMYLPILLVVHCILIWLNLWDRLTGACVSSKYRFSRYGAEGGSSGVRLIHACRVLKRTVMDIRS
jgi:hypothetical protein